MGTEPFRRRKAGGTKELQVIQDMLSVTVSSREGVGVLGILREPSRATNYFRIPKSFPPRCYFKSCYL